MKGLSFIGQQKALELEIRNHRIKNEVAKS